MKDEYKDVVDENIDEDDEEENDDRDEREEFEKTYSGDPELTPEGWGATIFKYQTEADIPVVQRKQLAPVRQMFGRHVSLGNTRRADNLRHLDVYDLTLTYMRIPLLRHMAVNRMGRTTSELQLSRSNEEVGGFERRMQTTQIKRESATVKDLSGGKKRGLLDKFLAKREQQQSSEMESGPE
jgi:hypothetical protein